jgi:zinc transport system substrate-binding protein
MSAGVGAVAPKVMVSGVIAPVSAMVREIGGESVVVSTLVPPGASPHVYEPSPMAVRGLRKAGLVVTIGNLGLAVAEPKRLHGLSPGARIVDLTSGEVLLDDDDHDHGDELGGDPHVWMSPVMMERKATVIADSLGAINPSEAPMYHRNAAVLSQRLRDRAAEYRDKFKGQNILVIVVHPSLSYLAKDIGFTQLAIEAHGRPPSVRQLRALIATAKKSRHCVIVLQPQYGQDLVDVVSKQTGVKVISGDIYRSDYPESMFMILDRILAATLSPNSSF